MTCTASLSRHWAMGWLPMYTHVYLELTYYENYIHVEDSMNVHENSVRLSSTTNPKPKGQPSHCLLRQT
jgi:hypothetical protein